MQPLATFSGTAIVGHGWENSQRCCLRIGCHTPRDPVTTPTQAARPTLVDTDPRVAAMVDGHQLRHLPSGADRVDVDSLMAENANLRAQLATLPVIEQAKGILIVRYQISADAAFALLRRWSSRTNIKLREISRLLVQAAVAPPADGSTASRSGLGSTALEQLIAELTSQPARATHSRRANGAGRHS